MRQVPGTVLFSFYLHEVLQMVFIMGESAWGRG